MELKICHLYPDVLNLYGDGGNIICMKKRLEWRGIDCEVTGMSVGDTLYAKDHDLFFIGGGQDFEQKVLLEDARNLMVVSPEKKKLVAISGLENFIVVDTDDVLLICPKDDKRFKDFISGIAMPEYEKYR